ncbi:MAG: FKBP-type peptidyl-prolyl cis-trans isomerase [Bacteroidota bacterium]
MKLLQTIIAGFLVIGVSVSCDKLAGGDTISNASIESSLDSVSYSAGVSLGNNLKSQIEDFSSDLVLKGMADVLKEKDLVISQAQCEQLIQEFVTQKQQEQAAEGQQTAQENLEKGMAFLEENGKKDGITTTESGLQYEVMKEGTGASPKAEDVVTVHYHGTLLDGTVFDSSVDRGEPTSFPLNRVIPGWTEGLQLMKTGAKYKFFIPSALAYGPAGSRGAIGPNETLIFEVELISIGEAPQ